MKDTQALASRSVALIREHQDAGGAYPACPTFANYRYSWFRDGSFIADAMSRAGEVESSEAFFGWCTRVLVAHRDRPHFHTRYTLAGEEGADEWPTFQLDGFGLWLWALREHERRHRRSLDRFREGAELARAFLERRWRDPSTDWWEERDGLHAVTLACIHAGLAAWGSDAAEAVAAAIDVEGERADASQLVLLIPFGLRDDDAILRRVEATLVSPGGGVHRHPDDTYYGGGEWLLLTALLGWVYAERGRRDEAADKLAWVAAHATPEGELPEQSQDHLLAPGMYEQWVARWGPPPSPLLWSHAMFLTLATALR